MASFSHLWVLALFLVTVLRASDVARSDQSHNGSQGGDRLGSLAASGKLFDSTSIGKARRETDMIQKSKANGESWCLPHDGIPDPQLKGNLDYACGHGANCNPIQPGGSCFKPNTMQSHAAYAMNSYYQTNSKEPGSCDFKGTGTVTNNDPSYGNCKYPG